MRGRILIYFGLSVRNNCSHDAYNWTNITNDFFDAVTGIIIHFSDDNFINFEFFSVSDLSLGELLHCHLFGLFEAMSAIEMMDPKMDAGMLCNRGKKKALSLEQAVQVNKFST